MGMFGTSWRVGRVAGIEVRIDSSWAVIALLITYSMYLRLSVLYPELEGGGAVGLAIGSAVLFFGSVLVHELAHALVAQARGIRVQDITLFLFGGATRARVESRGPGDEFLIALVGPLTSGLLAGLFGILASLGRDVLSRPLAGTFGYLAWTNLLLAGFNLVPGFPLDGGRLLRAAIWKTTGSLARATRTASVSGQGVGWLLVAAGVAWLLAGDLAGGIWFAFIGWFLVQAARSSYQDLELQQLLAGVEAEDVMAADPAGAGPHGPARRPGRGGPRCPDGQCAWQAPGRRGRTGPGGPGWRGGGDHHPFGPDPLATPLANPRRQGALSSHGRSRLTGARQTTTSQSRWPPADANAPRRQPDLAGRVHRVDGATAWQVPDDRRAVRRLVPAPMRGNGNV